MKTYISPKYLIIISIFWIFLIFSCTENITNANERNPLKINGIIRNDNGTPVTSVMVYLFQPDFNPYTDVHIDSTVSDPAGRFSFSLRSIGLYNLYIKSKQGFCFEGSIPVTEKERVVEKECILKDPGVVSGIVNLRQCDNNKNAIILVFGTNSYAMPDDSTGAFSIPALAEGTYHIRVLSLIKGYGYYDSTIIVKAGERTELSGKINLSYGVPDIQGVKAVYDRYFMRATLSWHFQDTSNIRSFFIFRNSSVAEKPLAIICNSCTTFTDNVLMPDPIYEEWGNVLRYTITACGRDGSLGKSVTLPDIERRSVLLAEDTVNIVDAGINEPYNYLNITVDSNRNMYLSQDNRINKIDSTGRVCAEYYVPGPYQPDYIFSPVSDINGNIYYLIDSMIIKLSSDLTFSQHCVVKGKNNGR
jgi:hypothetical protein